MISSTLISGLRSLVTMNDSQEILTDAYVFIESGKIGAIGSGPPPMTADQVIDGTDHILIPGLINTHHHLYQTLTRNIPRVQASGLFEWLVNLYEIWRELTPEGVYASALVGMAELLASGCTTTSDHLYLFPNGQHGRLIDEEIRAAIDIGIRFQPCRGSMSRGKSQGGLPPDDVVQTEAEILSDSIRVLERYHDPAPLAMTRISLAPCSPFSVTDSLMRETARLARQWGVSCHTHLAETLDEEQYCLKEYGCRPLEYLERLGWLGSDIWLAHCVHLNDREVALLGKTATGVAHCPTSNLRLGSGIAPVRRMLDHRVPVGIGVDGSASNDSSHMLAETRMAMLVHRLDPQLRWISAEEALWMATRGGAQALGRDDIGRLEPGKAADLVLIDLGKVSYAGAQSDPLAAVVYNLSSSCVELTMVNGRIVFRNGRCLRIDEREAAAVANRISGDMLISAGRKTGIPFLQKE